MINYEELPGDLQGVMKGYIEGGIPPGGFLTSVLENNLTESFGRADDINRENIFEIVKWVYNNAPSNCWGSSEAVRKWLQNF